MFAPLIRNLTLQNFLSYGPDGVSVDLLPLNVLIGPNASGKSNLLEALSILRAAPSDMQAAIREGGGIGEYLWKEAQPGRGIQIRTSVARHRFGTRIDLQHSFILLPVGTRFDIGFEFIGMTFEDDFPLYPIYLGKDGSATMFARGSDGQMEETPLVDLKSSQSILAQRRDPQRFPEVTFLADEFGKVTLFREWTFGGRSAARLPQSTDLPSDYLLPDASNLGLVLHDLGQTSAKREELITYLRRFYDPARFISTKIQGGTLQLYIEEEGGRLIPATRLSDGTLRYLCLLAILCHPNPPPVVAIEEPELGLHPDILPTVAELLRKASERTQLFVTTHSDALVSALSDTPESILVCEATPDGTTMKRLEAEPLREWLEKYSLGEIWRMGEIGGNRW
ncbi:MAG TPA: AAA family ATPase [Longimicrobium sp.]|nr:AAA family ATPase [Longimicrobium sp.]